MLIHSYLLRFQCDPILSLTEQHILDVKLKSTCLYHPLFLGVSYTVFIHSTCVTLAKGRK